MIGFHSVIERPELGKPRGAADQDHDDDQGRERAKPDAQRAKPAFGARGLPVRGGEGCGRSHGGLIAGETPELNSASPAPLPHIRFRHDNPMSPS